MGILFLDFDGGWDWEGLEMIEQVGRKGKENAGV